MPVNIDPKTKVPYGIISANSLNSDVVDELLYIHGTDYTEEEALKEHMIERLQHELTEEEFDDLEECDYKDTMDEIDPMWEQSFFDMCPDFDEPDIAGEYEGVQYATCWLGGALNFWIFLSPNKTYKARRGSPCVPNAGVLDTLDGDYMAYDVPADWRAEN